MPIAALTPREAEVFALVCQGLTNKEVAAKMFIEIASVKFHLTNIYKKHNVKIRAQLFSKANEGVEA